MLTDTVEGQVVGMFGVDRLRDVPSRICDLDDLSALGCRGIRRRLDPIDLGDKGGSLAIHLQQPRLRLYSSLC